MIGDGNQYEDRVAALSPGVFGRDDDVANVVYSRVMDIEGIDATKKEKKTGGQ